MVSLIVLLLTGALIGWLASLIMKTDNQQGALLNIVIGVVGALLGRWLFADVLHVGGANAGALSITGVLWGVLGSCILLGLLKLVRVMA